MPHDPSGQRRWLPFEVKRQVDVDAITRDREQLWAEGADLFRRVGIQWFEAEKLAKPLLNDYVDEDAWTEIIKDFFATKEELEPKCWENGKIFTSADLLREAINLPAARTNQPEKNRMTNLVKRLSAELGIETKHTNSKRGFIRRE